MVTLVLACHLTTKLMLLCKLPTRDKTYCVVIDTGSNVTSFIDARPLQVTLSNGKQMKINPKDEIPPVSLYNTLVPKRQRIDGIIGQDVLSRFRSMRVDFGLRTTKITLVK